MARKQKPDPMRAVAYIRVSTAEQHIGPEAQRQAIHKWCEHHGIELVCEPFVDQGVSGGLDFDKRPALVDAIDALGTYNAGILVAHKRDRLARGVDVIANLRGFLRRAGRRICTTDKPPDSGLDTDDPFGRAMETMQDMFAELERSMIRSRTKAALAVKRRRGERVGTVPYGYRLAPDGKRLVPDKKEAKLVAKVKSLRAEGYSLRAIAAVLAKEGHRPKTGTKWGPSTIKAILELRPMENEHAKK